MNEIARPRTPPSWLWAPIDSIAEVLVSTIDKKSYENEAPVRLCNYTDVYYNTEITGGLGFMEATASAEQISRFSVLAGDVPVTKDSETPDDIGRPSFVPETLPGVVYGYHLAIYRPFDRRMGGFLRYVFESVLTRAELEVRTPGVTRVGLSRNTLRNLRIPVPDVVECVRVNDFLDHEIAEIDALVRDLDRTIALAKERRSALITAAVTGQIDVTAKHRPAVEQLQDDIEELV